MNYINNLIKRTPLLSVSQRDYIYNFKNTRSNIVIFNIKDY